MRRASFQVVVVAAAVAFAATVNSQEPAPGVSKTAEIATPFTVPLIKGRVLSWRRQPLKDASFHIVGPNTGLVAYTDANGSFEFRSTRPSLMFRLQYPGLANAWTIGPGTYKFRAAQAGFYATTGTIIVSADAPKDSAVDVELQPGPDADDRTFDQRAADWDKNQLPACAPGVNRDPKRKKYPGASIDVPVALGHCAFRSSEVVAKKGVYRFMLAVDRSLGVDRAACMLGVSGLSATKCLDTDPQVKAEWAVWSGTQAVARGASPVGNSKGLSDVVYLIMGYFDTEAGKRYAVEVKFLKDGSALNAIHPHLVVQRFK